MTTPHHPVSGRPERDQKPQAVENHYVLRVLATWLRTSIDRDASWLHEGDNDPHMGVNEPTLRRRLKAARSLIAKFERTAHGTRPERSRGRVG